MVRIQKLQRPNKRSGNLLAPGETTNIRGLTIVNRTAGKGVYVDKFTRGEKRKKAKKRK